MRKRDDLSGDMKKHVEGLRVIHDHDFILSLAPGLSEVEDKGEYVELPPSCIRWSVYILLPEKDHCSCRHTRWSELTG